MARYQYAYAVFDPYMELFPRQYAHAYEVEAIDVPISHPDMQRAYRPYLLPLKEPGRDWWLAPLLDEAIAQAKRQKEGMLLRPICGWLFTDLQKPVLRSRLSHNATVYMNGKARIFRNWDPRVLDLLRILLDAQQKQAIVADMEWLWLGRSGLPYSLSGEEVVEQPRGFEFTLRQDQIENLRHAEVFHTVLDVMQDLGYCATDDALALQLLLAIRRGNVRWALETSEALVEFALHALLVHPNFDDDPQIKSLMKQSHAARLGAIQPLATLNDDDWAQVRERCATFSPALNLEYMRELGHVG
ncbi:hypothetical protein CO611_09045 [Lysobacteraceae bacterium NML03-0222]|nr:hypothetical protein CO611_09045 [Xanthomonadaceae bacterium NML03-0222]